MRKALLLCVLAIFVTLSRIKGAVEQPNWKTHGDDTGNADQRGTKELPLVVDAEGHQQTEAEKNEATKKEDRTREFERWTIYFAQLTAWSTVALFAVGFAGVIAAVCTLRDIKRQADLTHAMLMLSFPPKMIVRNVILHRRNIPQGTPLCIEFTIANTGGSRAHIIESHFDSSAFEDGPPPYMLYTSAGGTPNIWNVTLMAGEERTFIVNIEDKSLIEQFGAFGTHDTTGTVQQRICHVYFFGRAKYQTDRMTGDQEGVIRSMAVCRHYNLKRGGFESVADSEYEY